MQDEGPSITVCTTFGCMIGNNDVYINSGVARNQQKGAMVLEGATFSHERVAIGAHKDRAPQCERGALARPYAKERRL